MDIIISYDVDKNSQSEVKKALLTEGFKDVMKNGNDTYNMPNTTLILEEVNTPMLAKAKFEDVIERLNEQRSSEDKITITRFIACGISLKTGLVGDKHTDSDVTSYHHMTFEEKKDYFLLMLYRCTEANRFLGQISPYIKLKEQGYVIDSQEINAIVNNLKRSELISSNIQRTDVFISFDNFGKGIEFVENNSFSSPGTSILELTK